jgi:hypothetical protein
VKELLLEVGVSMLCAKPKTGKSTFARQLAVSVAEGRDFLGKGTLEGDVLYLNLEGPVGVLQQHLQKLGYSETKGVIHIVHEQMPFRGVEGLEKLSVALKKLSGVRLVIVDPIAKFLRLADSDDYDEVSLGIEKLEQLTKHYKLHLMIVTHGKKRNTDDVGDSPIGSTGFRGGTDTNVFLSKQGVRRVISTEQRWGVAMEPTLLVFNEEQQTVELGTTLDEEQKASHEAKDHKTLQRIQKEIRSCLIKLGKPTQQELLAFVTGKTTTVLGVLNQMTADGIVMEESEGRSRRYQAAVPLEEVQPAKSAGVTQTGGMASLMERFGDEVR